MKDGAYKRTGPPMRVLLVEDTPDLGRVLQRIMNCSGRPCTLATTLKAAVAAVATAVEPFDVIVTDIGLPDGDGRDLLKLTGTTVPAIVLSALGEPDDKARSAAM